MKRGSRIKPVSANKKRQNAQRKVMLARIGAERGEKCQRCGRAPGNGWVLDGHELRKRSQGGSITDPENVVLLCRLGDLGCHPWTEHHPALAAAQGWVVRGGDSLVGAAGRRSLERAS